MTKNHKNTHKTARNNTNANADQDFNDRAEHLKKNIYGSDKGRLRLAILQRDLAPLITNHRQSLTILDAGCGAGLMSAWAASYGHLIVACDTAATMVRQAQKNLNDYANAQVLHTAAQDLPLCQTYDIVFCHALLEWVAAQDSLLTHLARLLKPGGYLSLMFYNAWAREMAQLVYGNFDYIDKGYQVRQRVKLSPHWPAFPDRIEQQLRDLHLTIQQRSGIRVFYDIIRDRKHYQMLADDIIRHELRISQQYPYWQLGRYVHFLAQKVT